MLSKELPAKEVLDVIKKGKSALALILAQGEEVEAYYNKLDEAKKAVGPDHLVIVNEECLWEKSGKEQMYQLISEVLKAKYDRLDIINIFSETFQRVLEEVGK